MDRIASALAAIILTAFFAAALAAVEHPPIPRFAPNESPEGRARSDSDTQLIATASNPPAFADVDKNGDDLIDSQEAIVIGIPFSMLDLNGDGNVTRSEYSLTTARFPQESAIELE